MKTILIRNLRARLVRVILYLCLALSLSAGAFFFMRYLTACWQLTSLPGVPPAYCHSGFEKPFELSAFDETDTPA